MTAATSSPRPRAAVQWPDGWYLHDDRQDGCWRECRCGQPCEGSDSYLHACSPSCAVDREAELEARVARFGATR